MQQTLDFSIEIFDIRTKNSVKIKDDRGLVRSIQINKDLQLNNQAVITFAKSKSYALLNIEESIKLYNYVKIELKVKNYESGKPAVEEILYFSGFIQNVGKQIAYGSTPRADVSITIVDFANLFKTTFYTKNITFFNILEQAVPEFRLLNFQEVFSDPEDKKNNKLLDDFYSVNQIGFIFFSFFFFKFLYNIVYDKPGEQKKIGKDNIFKQFKIYMPFGFDLKDKSSKKVQSMFNSQVSSLIIYKKLQGVALDLYKYLYPEPIFEFSTYETRDSVALIIRPTPFMSFDRPQKDAISTNKIGTAGDVGDEDLYETVKIQGSVENIDSFRVIEQDDFGFSRVAKSKEEYGSTPGAQVREHLQKVTKIIDSSTRQAKGMEVDSLIVNQTEEDEIIAKYFKMIPFDIRFIESINMTRSAKSVVNVVWTTPATDTAVLQTSGRSLVMGLFGEKLDKMGKDFSKYVADQYIGDQNPNPAFFWNYRNINPDKYISGDINYFGLREFEVKWNCLTLYDSSVYFVLNYIDKKILEELKNESRESITVKTLETAIYNITQRIDKEKEKKSESTKKPKVVRNEAPPKIIGIYYEQAFEDRDFNDAADILKNDGFDVRKFSKSDLPAFIKAVKDGGSLSLGAFTAKLNGIISRAYRENEHLYDCQIIKPINLSIIPGMIIDSKYPNAPEFNTPRFRGYVTRSSHAIDFNAASMKSTFMLTRTASNDSAIIIKEKS